MKPRGRKIIARRALLALKCVSHRTTCTGSAVSGLIRYVEPLHPVSPAATSRSPHARIALATSHPPDPGRCVVSGAERQGEDNDRYRLGAHAALRSKIATSSDEQRARLGGSGHCPHLGARSEEHTS